MEAAVVADMRTKIIALVLMLGCSEGEHAKDSAERPDGSLCEAGRVWNEYYDSCVNACPAGGWYDHEGMCTGPRS